MTTTALREAVAVFHDTDALERAVYALETDGFDRAAFSVLATEDSAKRVLGHRYRRIEEVEDNPAAPRETFFSRVSRLEADYLPTPVLAMIGALLFSGMGPIAVLVAAGSGALLGAELSQLLHAHNAQRVAEQLARGGLLLWVNIRNRQEEKTAVRVLRAHSAHDVHVHDIPPAAARS